MNRTKLSNNPNVANKGNKMNNGNFGKLVGVLKNKSRKQIHVLKENQLQEKRYMLKSQVMVLFTLRNKIDTETILIVPFQISIPENFPISYNQKLLLSQVLNLKMKRDCLLKDKEFFNTNLFGIEGQNLTQEGVSIEHKLIAYYVSKHDGRVRQSDDSVPVPIPTTNASAITKIVSEEKFEVYHRMKNIDFQKAVFEGKLTANREDGKTCCMGLIKRNFNFKLKISLDRLTFRNRDSAINIVINYPNKMLAVYDYIDVILVSKCKIKAITYEADIRRKLKDSLGKMIGIDLQGLKEVHEEDMKEKEKAKEIAKFRSMNIEPEKSKKGKISLIQLNKGSQQKLKAKPTSRKNISRKVIKVKEEEDSQMKEELTPKSKNLLFTRMNIQQPENKSSPKVKSKKKKRNVPKPKVSMKTGETKASVNQKLSLKSLQSEAGDFEEDDEDKEDAEGFKSIERLVYATSLDLIGKRKVNIDMDSESINYDKNITELVHKINISDIKVALETVQTEYMSLDYNLIFFASVGPLGFNKKIKEIPMRFVALPKEFGGFKHDICTAWNNIEKKISQVDYVFMLPHAKVKVR